MARLIARRAVAVLACGAMGLGGCRRSGEPEAPTECQRPPADWLAWLVRDPDAARRFEQASEGWVAFYGRKYLEAVDAFEASMTQKGRDSAVERAGLARAHEALGALYGRLARLQAEALLAYLEARRRADAKSLASAPALATLAAAVTAAEAPTWATRGAVKLAGLFADDRCDRAKTRADVVRQRLTCDAPPACPERAAPSGLAAPWGPRLDAFGAALCAPAAADLAELRRLARTPAAQEELTAEGGAVAAVEVQLHEPLALWVLGEVHRLQAEALASAAPPADWMARLWSPSGDGRPLPDGLTVEEARKAAAGHRRALDAARACRPAGPGAALIDQLDLASTLADGVLRHAADQLKRAGACAEALSLLRPTLDPAAADQVTYRNEPGFLVQLASAAVCMRRLPEAIGALRAVRARFPEARGALMIVEKLAVARLMGGVGGLQKSQ